MHRQPSLSLFAALVCSATLLLTPPAWAAEPDTYIEASVGFTSSPELEGGGLKFGSDRDMALSLALGTSLSENTRTEAELTYLKAAWDMGSGVDVTFDGFGVGTNVLYDIGANSSPAKFEIGIGLGRIFADEVCAEGSDRKVCVDADYDDWNVQGILGGSYALSETGAIVVRYRMLNIGGFSSEDRLHIFTAGYRHHF